MRSLTDNIANGPFRDDTHRAAVEATAVDLAGRQLSGVSGHVPGSPEKPADGKIEANGRVMMVEAEDGRVRARNPFRRREAWTPAMDAEQAGYALDTAIYAVGQVYDAATRALASAGPLPLASNEPWVEPIRDYGARLQRSFPGVDLSVLRDDVLECFGDTEMIPRGRLVPAITKEGM